MAGLPCRPESTDLRLDQKHEVKKWQQMKVYMSYRVEASAACELDSRKHSIPVALSYPTRYSLIDNNAPTYAIVLAMKPAHLSTGKQKTNAEDYGRRQDDSLPQIA